MFCFFFLYIKIYFCTCFNFQWFWDILIEPFPPWVLVKRLFTVAFLSSEPLWSVFCILIIACLQPRWGVCRGGIPAASTFGIFSRNCKIIQHDLHQGLGCCSFHFNLLFKYLLFHFSLHLLPANQTIMLYNCLIFYVLSPYDSDGFFSSFVADRVYSFATLVKLLASSLMLRDFCIKLSCCAYISMHTNSMTLAIKFLFFRKFVPGHTWWRYHSFMGLAQLPIVCWRHTRCFWRYFTLT